MGPPIPNSRFEASTGGVSLVQFDSRLLPRSSKEKLLKVHAKRVCRQILRPLSDWRLETENFTFSPYSRPKMHKAKKQRPPWPLSQSNLLRIIRTVRNLSNSPETLRKTAISPDEELPANLLLKQQKLDEVIRLDMVKDLQACLNFRIAERKEIDFALQTSGRL